MTTKFDLRRSRGDELTFSFLVTVVLVLAFGLAGDTLRAESPMFTDQLLEMNRKLFETAMLDQDPKYLEANTTEAYVVIAPGGVVENRDQVILGMRAFANVESVSVTDEMAIIQGTTAIVISRLEIKGEVQIPIPPGPRRVLRVFSLLENGEWKAVSTSITPCHPRAVKLGRC